ncbi:MAG: M17 family peptidase N-terminal domain-containing protein, partial [Nocardioides sp.]
MTTYNLRSASPAKTHADAVVVGVVKADKGVELAPGAEDVVKAYGRKLRPLLATLDVTGKAGEVTKVPTNGAISSPLLILIGLGSDVDAKACRRAAGVAARAATNVSSVAVALPADTAELVRAVTEGCALGAYTFTAYKKDPKADKAAGTVTVLSPAARKKDL